MKTTCLGALILVLVGIVRAQTTPIPQGEFVPKRVHYSGVLHLDKDVLANGIVGVTFALYKDQDGGSPLWLETQNVPVDAQGRFSIQLGATTTEGLPTQLFSSGDARWLGVQASGMPEQPRVLLLSVPYALKAADAETIGGLPPSAFVLSTSASQHSGASSASGPSSQFGLPALSGSGTQNYLPLWIDNNGTLGNSILYQKGSGKSTKVGINITNPLTTLDVNGTTLIRGMIEAATQGVATPAKPFSSYPVNIEASAFDSRLGQAIMQHFEWEAEPTGNNSANTGATLNLLFGQQNGQPGETGVKISDAGIFSFAAGQTFPGTGTVTSVALSAPSADFKVSGSPVTGNGTLGLAWNLSPTDANTANAIVKRDANGSFSAGAITSNLGLTAISSKSNALYAESSLVGVVGKSTGNHYGVWGESSGTATDADGIHAVSDGNEGYGLSALNLSDGGTAMSAHGGSGPGSSFGGVGLESQGGDEGNGFGGVGVIGYGGNGGAGGGWGAEFFGGSGNGHDAGIGVYAQAGSGNNPVAGEFIGDVEVLGNLSKASGSFKIDHPLDPANKYLYHSFVESPDMMNIYNGLASLDSEGEAWITLPGYFEALNQDFRYQLTAIGAPGPNLYIAQEISSNRFKIAGGRPGAKVSWQVTGIRHDAWANAHRMLVEPEKPEYEKGFYLHPELFGAPPDKGLHRSHDPQAMKLMNARQRLRK